MARRVAAAGAACAVAALLMLTAPLLHSRQQQPAQQQAAQHVTVPRTFAIANDRFVLDGVPITMASGSIHYHRIHPTQWHERLAAMVAMGLNAVQLYVPWNYHQPNQPGRQGVLPLEGWRDVGGFIEAAGDAGLLVLLRPGPYICAEWEFGGLPAWLLANDTSSSTDPIRLRSSDPRFLAAVDDWWGVLLPALAHLTVDRGGPIAMVQVENEYGYFGRDKSYLRHLAGLIRRHMGTGVVLYTVDGASLLPVVRGSLPGEGVLTTVDFGPTTDVAAAFELQRRFNPAGQSPPFVVEYYSGWLTHWGEPMANTSTQQLVDTLSEVLAAGGGTGSFNLYMAAGGTNFGPWAGANVFETGVSAAQQLAQHLGRTPAQGELPGPEVWRLRQAAQRALKQQQQQQAGATTTTTTSSSSSSSSSNYELFSAHTTTYDYDAPLGEGGSTGQQGVGGANKFDAVQQLLATARAQAGAGQHQQQQQQLPVAPRVEAYGAAVFSEGVFLIDTLDGLSASCRGSTYAAPALGGFQAPAGRSSSSRAGGSSSGWGSLLRLRTTRERPQPAAAAPGARVASSSFHPLPMELYGQYYGVIAYSAVLGPETLPGGVLGLTAHDTVWAFLDGQLVGHSYRASPAAIVLPAAPFSEAQQQHDGVATSRRKLAGDSSSGRLLTLLVWPMGRNNFALSFGGKLADPKGLLGGNVTLGGRPLTNWTAHHLCLEHGASGLTLPWRQLQQQQLHQGKAASGSRDQPPPLSQPVMVAAAATAANGSRPPAAAGASSSSSSSSSAYYGRGGVVLRGTLTVPAAAAAGGSGGLLPSTFLSVAGWGRGEVWVNGESLGRYWSGQGPQETLFVPGAFLRPGANEVAVLELDGRVPRRSGDGQSGLPVMVSVAHPDFTGPPGGPEPLWGS